MRVLAHQRPVGLSSHTASSRPTGGTSRGLIVTSLLLADIVLVGLAVLWRQESVRTMGSMDALACIGAVLVGAWAALLGVWIYFKD